MCVCVCVRERERERESLNKFVQSAGAIEYIDCSAAEE